MRVAFAPAALSVALHHSCFSCLLSLSLCPYTCAGREQLLNLALEKQAVGRVYRLGQARPVTVSLIRYPITRFVLSAFPLGDEFFVWAFGDHRSKFADTTVVVELTSRLSWLRDTLKHDGRCL